ncbi:MAG: helix-turn-helix domain-containing protein [Candidatus Dormibacteria bacterium]
MRPLASSLIIDARERAGLPRRELARRAGTSASALIEYERGIRHPSVPTLLKILRAAGFDLRTRLAPVDTHDEVLETWRKSLSAASIQRMDADRAKLFRDAVVVPKH